MKKILLIAIVGTLFATSSAFAHCGSCGVGDEAHAEKKACCAEKADCKKDCEKACCAAKKAECSDKKENCKEKCSKPCCAKEKADETAASSTEAPACCPAKAAKTA